MSPDVETRPVRAGDVDDLTELFGSARTTRHCWCMAFCTTRREFAVGWFGGGNRRRFVTKAAEESAPMGVLASVAGEPVGWCACGPRSRYVAVTDPSRSLLKDRDPSEDASVWLLPCLYVRDVHRGQGLTYVLVRAAVELARQEGAPALEGWPLASSEDRQSGESFLGRQSVFERAGFRCVAQPTPQRVIMRLDFTP